MKLLRAFAGQPRLLILAEMVATILVIGVIDAATGFQIRLLPFYAGPVFAAAWFCGRKQGILAGALAGLTSLTADWISRDPDLHGYFAIWEITRHIISCVSVAVIGLLLRAKSDITSGRIALLEHSQRLEREIVQISEDEQRRIGRDLHDGLCQSLAAMACSASSLYDDLQQLKAGKEAEAAEELADLLREAVVQTRDLAHELVPAHLDQVGLGLALESLANSVSRLQGITCTFESRGSTTQLTDQVAGDFYRIAQEAIANATRHGKAKRVAIDLAVSNGLTTLRIEDDGTGIDQTNGHDKQGLGLNLMRYRARQNGGDLHISTALGAGTTVLCTARNNGVGA
jgi:signal transduction histidine kinase